MNTNDFLMLLDEIVEAESGTIKSDDTLADIDGWDSMAVLGFIAMLDEKLGLIMAPEKIAAAVTVMDLIDLVNKGIAAIKTEQTA